VVTLSGIVTEIKPEQHQKAQFPIEVRLSGIVIEVKPEHQLYLQPVIAQ
jgi:hypothetical protein